MSTPAPLLAPTPPERILWEVVERHFEEAEFLFEQWESALYSPVYTLDELARTLETRLLAHLDGLILGGRAVAERLLQPALEDEIDTEPATVAALALLESGNRDLWQEVVEEMIFNEDHDLRDAIARALMLFDAPHFDLALQDACEWARSPLEKSALLEVLAERRLDPGPLLESCLGTGYVPLDRAVVRMAGRGVRRDLEVEVARQLRADDPSVRHAAIEAGLVFGFSSAWRECLDLACRSGSTGTSVLLHVALLGAPSDHAVIYEKLDADETREAALWAAGFTGRLEAVERCLPFLESENTRVAKLAAEAIGAVTGLDIIGLEADCPREPRRDGDSAEEENSEDEGLLPFEVDDLDADLVPDAVDELPLLDPRRVRDWLEVNRSRFLDEERYLSGSLHTPEALVAALHTAAMRRRHGLGLELFIRSGGQRHVDTRGFTNRQKRELDALADLDPTELRSGPYL